MRFKFFCFLAVFCILKILPFGFKEIPSVSAQTNVSVPLDNQIYRILEQAQLRGLCSPMSGVKPYTRDVVVSAIEEILNSEKSGKLSAAERAILEQALEKFSIPAKKGINWKSGSLYTENTLGGKRKAAKEDGKNESVNKSESEDGPAEEENTAEAKNEDEGKRKGIIVSANLGLRADIEGSGGMYLYTPKNERYYGTETWLNIYLNGDISRKVSYNFDVTGGFIQAPRKELGQYNTYYEGFYAGFNSEYENRKITVYSEPLNYFPYTYEKKWDGSVFFLNSLSSYDYWPKTLAGGYGLSAELTGAFLDNKLILRMSRMRHEWGSTPMGTSLSFNKAARPFFGFEMEFKPFSWFNIASLAGALEYLNDDDIKVSSSSFQNFYSINILQFRFKNYFFLDISDIVVFPKRFEAAYMVPIISKFFYQNNIGDYDNMALSFNVKAQYPGLGNIWFSFFMDEMNFLNNLFRLDRQMFAVQLGSVIHLPFLSFTSIKLSYTVVNPYCYTHNRNYNPWYGNTRMETAYINNGVSLGYYLPPNSDELLLRFETMAGKNLTVHFQYQMIRHGADFGESAVDGSNLASELDPNNRDKSPVLKKFFLQDGAYQWQYILKLGADWRLGKAPFAFYGEAGTVISYFTNTNARANSGKPHSYHIINTPDYPRHTAFIARLGFRLFPQ